MPLWTSKKRPGEHKRPVPPLRAVAVALGGRHVLVEAVDVVHVAVLPVVEVDGIFVHRDLRPVKNRRLEKEQSGSQWILIKQFDHIAEWLDQ